MRLSIFQGNFYSFSHCWLSRCTTSLNDPFLKQSVRLIFQKQAFNFFCHCKENHHFICSEWSSAQVRWCVAYCMRYLIHSNKFEHKKYLEVFIHWISKQNWNESIKSHFLFDSLQKPFISHENTECLMLSLWKKKCFVQH